ncbi:MAG: hypothetical protein HON66_04850 [Formosa sp.]|mgnify:FL=1|jgi:hypothetical protein|nr:hypothetical protein [Formosa sp.]MDC0463869.1 hypothetical protein [Flavobacteriaceae bacterium]MDC3198633.1 hypothetical protein [Flavobacteriaceae bacterium]MDC3350558.1 hypothetical protein [Flavobacteriaceae bacterium]|tara:strand:+ start:5820 stop:6338 length:519 start_codon:yes stop_codon:yes gene_type:complete
MDFLENNFKWFFAFLALVIIYKFLKDYLSYQNKNKFLSRNDSIKSDILKVKLQAYERLALFLERISLTNLLTRVPPISTKKEDYQYLLIQTIEQEFEHNMLQQIYVSEECWNIILTAKNSNIQYIRNCDTSNNTLTADKFRELVLTMTINDTSSSGVALSYLKNEVSKLTSL